MTLSGGLLALCMCATPALAQEKPADSDPVAPAASPPAALAPAVSAREEAPPLPTTPKSPYGEFKMDADASIEEVTTRPYRNTAYLGGDVLNLDPQYVHEVQEGLEKLYRREYTGARNHFEAVDKAFPGTGVAAVNDVLVWQALMLENFDFSYDKRYWTSSARARKELDVAVKADGGQGWVRLLYCGVSGIEAIHTMRQSQYTKALNLAFEAMGHLQKARESSPAFPDLMLADGMYNYWRTVVTMSSKVLPDFGDHRAEGIEQMQSVESAAIFLGSPTTLALAFTWLEEGDMKRAMSACQRNRKSYPHNIVNNLVTGTTYVAMKQPAKALAVFDAILKTDNDNKRVRYWRGVALFKMDKFSEAEAELRTYLSFDYMEKYQRAAANYRLGMTLQRQK
jgi:tetratricopeptide (TPR) repeat protein